MRAKERKGKERKGKESKTDISPRLASTSISEWPIHKPLPFLIGLESKLKKMARGKIQIKRIENVTNRQVTYSKRRNGLFKKANELTVLCDAKVSLLMVSSSGKLHEFISPSTTTKQVYDDYQKLLGIDLWKSHYETMQENLNKLKEINKSLRRQIRVGECLNDLRFAELHSLEKEMESAVEVVRNRKLKLISNQIDTKRKKIRNATECNRRLYEYDAMEEPHYGLVDDGGDYYDSAVIGYSANEDPHNVFPFRLQPSHHPNLHHGGGSSDLTTYSLL